jgi:hypothetical protein
MAQKNRVVAHNDRAMAHNDRARPHNDRVRPHNDRVTAHNDRAPEDIEEQHYHYGMRSHEDVFHHLAAKNRHHESYELAQVVGLVRAHM